MRRALTATAVILVCSFAVAAEGPKRDPLGLGWVGDRRVELAEGAELSPGEALSVYLRVPAEGRLTGGGATAGSLGARAETAQGHKEGLTVSAGAESGWSIDLAGLQGQIVEVSLENQADAKTTLRDLRLDGSRRTAPAVLSAGDRPEGARNVIVYVIDTLRADHLTPYGAAPDVSPFLDDLAGRSALLRRGYSLAASTPPSISGLFASLPPYRLAGTLTKATVPTTLAEAFQAAGHATASFQANFLLIEPLGFSRGFDTYEMLRRRGKKKMQPVDAEAVHEAALAWLREHRDEPFFLYIQTMDAHFPYDPPSPYAERCAVEYDSVEDARRLVHSRIEADSSLDAKEREARLAGLAALKDDEIEPLIQYLQSIGEPCYEAAIAYADAQLGQFVGELEKLGVADRTAIVVTADHGEPLNEHGALDHGVNLYEEQIHVPLLVHMPGAAAQDVDVPVSLIDVAPTVLDWAGLPVPGGFAGRSLLQPDRDGRQGVVFGERLEKAVARSGGPNAFVREGDWKLILTGEKRELYDLAQDPDEARDRSSDDPIRVRYLESALRRVAPPAASTSEPASLSDADAKTLQQSLRALGYID